MMFQDDVSVQGAHTTKVLLTYLAGCLSVDLIVEALIQREFADEVLLAVKAPNWEPRKISRCLTTWIEFEGHPSSIHDNVSAFGRVDAVQVM